MNTQSVHEFNAFFLLSFFLCMRIGLYMFQGASVIRMIEFCLGKETFQRGLQVSPVFCLFPSASLSSAPMLQPVPSSLPIQEPALLPYLI